MSLIPKLGLLTGLRRLDRLYQAHSQKANYVKTGRKVFNNAGLLESEIYDRRYLGEIQKYWKLHYGKTVNATWHMAFAKYTGKKDVRYIPHYLYVSDILPLFNNMNIRPAFLDKNLAPVFLDLKMKTPHTVIKKMHGNYYDENDTLISKKDAFNLIISFSDEMIIKPSQTDNGIGIRKLFADKDSMYLDSLLIDFNSLEAKYGNDFVIQERMKQHKVMASPHPGSLNTIRVLTFRWKQNILILLAFARFGSGGKITDNAGTGGVLCGADRVGVLNSCCVDGNAIKHSNHPTSWYSFQTNTITIPSFDKIRSHAIRLHSQLFHFDLVSWDFAVGEDGEPVFLEVNFKGSSWLYQLACEKPIFGDLTDDVLRKAGRLSPKKGLNHLT